MKTVTRKSLTVHLGGIGASFVRDGKVVGTARGHGNKWALRIPGHLWKVTPDMPTARFNALPGGKITHVPVKGFKSWQACADEIERVVR